MAVEYSLLLDITIKFIRLPRTSFQIKGDKVFSPDQYHVNPQVSLSISKEIFLST